MIRDGLREVRRVLLEVDVNYRVTREFVERVQARAVGETNLRRSRISKGGGRSVSQVSCLMKQFKEMKMMIKQLKGMCGISGMMPC